MSEIFRDAIGERWPNAESELKLLVYGGRDYFDTITINKVLDEIAAQFRIGLVVHGGAGGADTLAGAWAMARGIQDCIYRANWTYLRNSAGPIRNTRMLRWGAPDLAVAFPGGTGTADMTRKIGAAGIRLFERHV